MQRQAVLPRLLALRGVGVDGSAVLPGPNHVVDPLAEMTLFGLEFGLVSGVSRVGVPARPSRSDAV